MSADDSHEGFSFEVVGDSGPIAPNGLQYESPWWDEPVAPDQQIPMITAAELIEQINEPLPGGKQSCLLTSQLNAWILRDYLSTEEAAKVQRIVSSDPNYRRYWQDPGMFDKDYEGWTSRSADTAYAVWSLVRRRMAIAEHSLDQDDPIANLQEILDDGFAAIISDERHSRTAFKPSDSDRYFVYDPKYKDMTGLYAPAEISPLQTTNSILIV